MSVGSPTAGTWSSSQWRPDNEFETGLAGRTGLRSAGIEVRRQEYRPSMFLRAERDRERCARRNVASILDAARELGILDAQEDQLVLATCHLKRRVTPRIPIDRIVLVLEKIRALFLGEAIRHVGGSVPWRRSRCEDSPIESRHERADSAARLSIVSASARPACRPGAVCEVARAQR